MKQFFSKLTPLGKIVLILIVLLSLWRLWPGENKIIPAAEQIPQLAERIRQKFAKKPDFWGLSTEWVLQNQAAPTEMAQSGGLFNRLDKQVLIGSSNGETAMPGSRSFAIIYKDLNRKECQILAAYPFAEKEKLGLLSLSIRNKRGEGIFDWGSEGGFPLSTAEAEKHCQEQNDLIWSFSK